MVDQKRGSLLIYLRWVTKRKSRGVPVGSLTFMREFAPKTAEAIMRTFLRYAGYEVPKLTKKERDVRERFVEVGDFGMGKMPTGGVSLYLDRKAAKGARSVDLNRFRVRLTKPQLNAICTHIAPELGWELTE